jgi:enoyl-CoA hydratase/carnithine racemase
MEKAIHQTPPILLRQDRGVVSILTLNRPEKLNALSNELIYAIIRALDVIELDPTIRVVVITGAGRAFCAGPILPHSNATCRPARQTRSRISCAPASK